MKILAVSDAEVGLIHSPGVRSRFKDVDLIISCGDLQFNYLEYIINALDVPMYYVLGNHAFRLDRADGARQTSIWGATNLHQQVIRDCSGILLAGIEGSILYNFGPHQYSQGDMWLKVIGLIPGLLINKIRYGRYLDIFVTHAPPWKIHDSNDRPHMGIKAFLWLDKVFQPLYHLHGHIHVYRQDATIETQIGKTKVINTYGYRVITLPGERIY
jgi:Icc-related predicted phosphoesterase